MDPPPPLLKLFFRFVLFPKQLLIEKYTFLRGGESCRYAHARESAPLSSVHDLDKHVWGGGEEARDIEDK